MRKAANVILPRLTTLSPQQQQQLPSSQSSSSKAKVHLPTSKITLPPASVEKSNTTGSSTTLNTTSITTATSVSSSSPSYVSDSAEPALPTTPSSSLPVSVVSSRRTKPLSLSQTNGSSIVVDAVRKTKLFVQRLFERVWNVCRGFIVRFPFLKRRPQ